MENAQYHKTIENASKAIERNPKDAQAYYERAGAYGVIGDSAKSIADFTMAINLSPSSGAYGGRGFEYYKTGDANRAIEDFKEAVKTDPDTWNYFLKQALNGTLSI